MTVDQNGFRRRPFDEKPLDKKRTDFQVLAVFDGGLTDVWPNASDLLTELDMNGDKEAILDAIKIIAPKVADVSVGTIRNNPLVFVQMDGLRRKIPARLLGAGAHKFLSLALAMHSHENMLCLLDEVTTGWHHSHLVELWRMILPRLPRAQPPSHRDHPQRRGGDRVRASRDGRGL